MAVSTKHKISRMDRLYEDERGYDFIGRTKLWYGITAALTGIDGEMRATGLRVPVQAELSEVEVRVFDVRERMSEITRAPIDFGKLAAE